MAPRMYGEVCDYFFGNSQEEHRRLFMASMIVLVSHSRLFSTLSVPVDSQFRDICTATHGFRSSSELLQASAGKRFYQAEFVCSHSAATTLQSGKQQF